MSRIVTYPARIAAVLCGWLLCSTPSAGQAQGVTFRDVAAGGGSGINYRRAPSVTLQSELAQEAAMPVRLFETFALGPLKPYGVPGTIIFDYDDDGDQDMYVTNGPGRANSLFHNLLIETGQLEFEDRGVGAGVGALLQDSTGGCAGDIDNDGDTDLYVLGRSEPNILFENQGDGTFVDVTSDAELAAGAHSSISCAMGDMDNDGLLDIAVANSFDFITSAAILVEPYAFNEPNQLFWNLGGNRFAEVSEAAGFRLDTAEITWSVSFVDIDQDGDADIVTNSDQGAVPPAAQGGVDRGFIRIFRNDGTGNFDDVTGQSNLAKPGAWMGLGFGDLDCDGMMDIFASNVGDYVTTEIDELTYATGDTSTRWVLQRPGGVFADPGVGDLVGTPWGWGTAVEDYDNDTDQDLIFHGGLDEAFFIVSDNPGTMLTNQDCSAQFVYDSEALARSANHTRRTVESVATGDLNNDGFVDIVTAAGEIQPEPIPLTSYDPVGSVFDSTAYFVEQWRETLLGLYEFTGIHPEEGDLVVEMNSADNGNGSVQVEVLGTVGLTTLGDVNRDGVGAVIRVTPARGRSTLRPVEAGSSYAAQHSLVRTFGVGTASGAVVDVLWPGGARNRLDDAAPGEHIRFPEIPCSYADDWTSKSAYLACVDRALGELVAAGELTEAERTRFAASASRAYAN